MTKITSIDQILNLIITKQKKKIAIAGASSDEIEVAAVAVKANLAEFILIGDKEKIENEIEAKGLKLTGTEIINEKDNTAAAKLAVQMVIEGQADIPMKGLIHTSTFMNAVLMKNCGLRQNRRISQIMVFDGYNHSLQFLTDCAINIKPNLKEKISIIENAVEVATRFGYKEPLIALLGAVETVNENMPSSMECAAISQMNRRGQIKGCTIDGPLSLDVAISVKAAEKKSVQSKVAGKAEILVASELETANIFGKALTYYGGVKSASVISGTASPVIMTSRTDTIDNKINSIAVACYLHEND